RDAWQGEGGDRRVPREIVERAAERGVGEGGRGAADRRRRDEGAQGDRREAGGVVDQGVREPGGEAGVEDGEEAAPADPGAQTADPRRRYRLGGAAGEPPRQRDPEPRAPPR